MQCVEEQAKDRNMTIEDGENGNAKYVIFALPTCQLYRCMLQTLSNHMHMESIVGAKIQYFIRLFACVSV